MNSFDIILSLILAWSVLTGFWSGFTRVGIGFAASVLGILFGFWFYDIPASWISEYLNSKTASNLFGFFVIFIGFAILGAIAGGILGKMLKLVGLSFLDRLGGAAFGFVRGSMIVVAVAMVVTAFAPNPPPRFIANSRVMPYAATAANVMAWLAPRSVKDGFYESLRKLRQVWQENDPRKKIEIMKGRPE